jgi:type IV pilus assembly protein PilC
MQDFSSKSEGGAELGVQLAELAKTGLPLAPGLRAMATELGGRRGRRAARALVRVADRLDSGVPLDTAMEMEGRRFPQHLRGLVQAGIQTGRLGEAMEEFVTLEQNRLALRRRIRLSLTYPAILFALGSAILLLFYTMAVPQFAKIYADFGPDLPPLTTLVISFAKYRGWQYFAVCGLVLLAIFLVRALGWPAEAQRIVDRIPIFGSIGRWAGAAEFARLAAVMLDQQVPLPEAFRLTTLGMRRGDYRLACRDVAIQLEAGRPLWDCLAPHPQVPRSLRPFVQWGDQTPSLAAGFRAAAEMFESRARLYTTIFNRMAPPLVFIFIWSLLGLTIIALFIPMVRIIMLLS